MGRNLRVGVEAAPWGVLRQRFRQRVDAEPLLSKRNQTFQVTLGRRRALRTGVEAGPHGLSQSAEGEEPYGPDLRLGRCALDQPKLRRGSRDLFVRIVCGEGISRDSIMSELR